MLVRDGPVGSHGLRHSATPGLVAAAASSVPKRSTLLRQKPTWEVVNATHRATSPALSLRPSGRAVAASAAAAPCRTPGCAAASPSNRRRSSDSALTDAPAVNGQRSTEPPSSPSAAPTTLPPQPVLAASSHLPYTLHLVALIARAPPSSVPSRCRCAHSSHSPHSAAHSSRSGAPPPPPPPPSPKRSPPPSASASPLLLPPRPSLSALRPETIESSRAMASAPSRRAPLRRSGVLPSVYSSHVSAKQARPHGCHELLFEACVMQICTLFGCTRNAPCVPVDQLEAELPEELRRTVRVNVGRQGGSLSPQRTRPCAAARTRCTTSRAWVAYGAAFCFLLSAFCFPCCFLGDTRSIQPPVSTRT
jgi:hypothetical protein